jgi:hypothetical protein
MKEFKIKRADLIVLIETGNLELWAKRIHTHRGDWARTLIDSRVEIDTIDWDETPEGHCFWEKLGEKAYDWCCNNE